MIYQYTSEIFTYNTIKESILLIVRKSVEFYDEIKIHSSHIEVIERIKIFKYCLYKTP